MTSKDLTHYRLQHQQLVNPKFNNPADVVAWLGAVQAQDFPGSLWSIGQRLNKPIIEADVEKGLSERSVIRTWPMRGTLHFVSAKDARWMLKYLTPRVISRAASIYKQAGLDKKIFEKSKRLWIKALEGGKQLTRDEMYEVLERAKITTDNSRGLHLLGYVAQEGVICFGARKGKQHTFTLLDEWIPSFPVLKKDEALAELALRYFTSHGPALVEDFMWWAGLPKGEATSALASIKSKLNEEVVDGKHFYFSSSSNPAKINPDKAYLLPTYDEYGIAYKDRTAFIDPDDHKKIGGIFTSSIVINGRIVGSWRRTLTKDSVIIETRALKKFTAAQKNAIKTTANHYGKFLGLTAQVHF